MTYSEQLDFIESYLIILNLTKIKDLLKPFSEICNDINLAIKTTIYI